MLMLVSLPMSHASVDFVVLSFLLPYAYAYAYVASEDQPLAVRFQIFCRVPNQKHHRLDASSGFYQLVSIVNKCSKSVNFIKLQQVCENQTCCNLIFADLL